VTSGILLIDKPAGLTSHDAVAVVRRTLRTRKVGHSGTLDPMATGLLVMGVGRATRLLRFLGELSKRYVGTGVLGVETTTLDADGEVARRSAVSIGEAEIREAMTALTGEMEQIPPAYSAVKVGGRKLYQAARAGRPIDAPPRRVVVDQFNLTDFDSPTFGFEVTCSGGTYVRSLVADVGARLGCGAHLSSLRRTVIGPFHVGQATSPGSPHIRPMEEAVRHLPAVDLTTDEAVAASHGRVLAPSGADGPFRVVAPDGSLIGIYRDRGTRSVPEVILSPG
jgi:tRNA pseudouridine55 synthase